MYEHPLAYMLGLEGIALLRGFHGDYDREFIEARLAEVRRLLNADALQRDGVVVDRVHPVDGYRVWSSTYDEPGNGIFEFEEPVVRDIVDTLPRGIALDAACGTGRYSEYLVARGHRVVGVDTSPDMLDLARRKLPHATFLPGDVTALPVADSEFDLVVCTLALTHLPSLEPAMAEFARVLRIGGHLVISDVHHELILRGSVPPVIGPDGRPGRLPAHRHLVGDYLRAALPLGLQLRQCYEPRLRPAENNAKPPPPIDGVLDPWENWPWALADPIPEAAGAAMDGTPATIIWDFELAGS